MRASSTMLSASFAAKSDLLISETASRRIHTGGSEERVSDFVTDEHVVHFVRHVLPHGQREHAVLDIERAYARAVWTSMFSPAEAGESTWIR